MIHLKTLLVQASAILICFLIPCDILSAAQSDDAWTLGKPAYKGESKPRIILLYDMEGLSGQDNLRSMMFGSAEYAQGQELLAADVNAVVAGLFDGGAASVHIIDGHGSRNIEPDLRTELLDPRAKQILRDKPFDSYTDFSAIGTYDAMVVVGIHSRTGSNGFAAHTKTPGFGVELNHKKVGETEILGLSWGRVDTPVIFASGDDVLAAELKDSMPWVEYVVVKKAKGAGSAELRPVAKARADLRKMASKAVGEITKSKVMKIKTPIAVTVSAAPPGSLKSMDGVPGIAYKDGTVSFEAEDFRSAYRGMKAIESVSQGTFLTYALEEKINNGDPAIYEAIFDGYIKVWTNQEANEERSDSQPNDQSKPERIYFGSE